MAALPDSSVTPGWLRRFASSQEKSSSRLRGSVGGFALAGRARELQLVEARVDPAGAQQGLVRTLLAQLAVVQH